MSGYFARTRPDRFSTVGRFFTFACLAAFLSAGFPDNVYGADATGDVVITGAAQVGKTLSVTLENVVDSDGLAGNTGYSYDWYRSRDDAFVRNGQTFQPAGFHVGQTFYVVVEFLDLIGQPERLTSDETVPVLAAPRGCASEYVWCEILTVGGEGNDYGYCHPDSGRCTSTSGALTGQTFTRDSTQYTIEGLRWGDAVHLTLDKDIPESDLDNLELKVDSHLFKLEDAARGNSNEPNSYVWTPVPDGLYDFIDLVDVRVQLLPLYDVSLSTLSVSPGMLSPVFTADTGSYAVSVAHSVETITITAEATESSATVTTDPPDEDSVASGHQVGLDVGENTIQAVVVNGNTTGRYTVTVTRAPAPVVSFGAATYTAEEGGSVEVAVVLDPALEAQVVIPITKTNQGATVDGDYSGVPSSLTFAAGVTSRTLTVAVADNALDDADRSIQISFGALPAPVEAGSPSATTVNFVDDDGPAVTVAFGAATYEATEGTAATVTVELSADPERTVEIPITATVQGGATAQGETDADYSGVPSSLTFSAGETSRSFTVTAADDAVDDDDESLTLGFGSLLPTGVTAGSPAETTVSLVDNDYAATATVAFDSSSYRATEGGDAAVVTVALSDDVEGGVFVQIFEILQGDTSDEDYEVVGLGGLEVVYAHDPSFSFTVTAVDDSDVDGGESVELGIHIIFGDGTAGEPATVHLIDDDGANVSVSYDSATHTATEGGSTAVVAVSLSEALTVQTVIPIAKTNQDTTTDADYTGVPSNLTFAAGDTSRTFTVTAVDDAVDDDGESVRLGFGALPTEVIAGDTVTSTVSLVDDDDPAVTVAFGAAAYAATEGGAAATVTVELSADPERTVTIPIIKTNQDTTTDADYSGVPSSLTFSAGETSMSFTVTAVDDAVDDDGESVRLGFGTTLPTRVTATAPAEATVSITDDDDPAVTVAFGAATYAAAEGGAAATVTVELSADPERAVTIPITQTNQGDAADADYSGVPSSLTFSAGETSMSFTVTATDDSTNDDGESVKLGFGALPTGVTAGVPSETEVAITDDDDDPAVTVSFGFATYTVGEGRGVTVTVELSADPERTVTIPLTRTNQDTTTDADYSGVPSSLTFSAGETRMSFTVTAADDSVDDDDESVKLGFGSTLPLRVTAATPTEATVNIADNDDPEVEVSFGEETYEAVEGGATATVTVKLSADPERRVTISITKTNQGDAADADYSGVPANVIFSTGETSKSFTVTATDDLTNDDGESVLLGFGSTLPPRVTAATPTEATVALTDDDVPAVTVKFGTATYTVAEGENVAVTVELSADPERTVTIPITKTNQDTTADADYTGVPANVIFSAGETSKSFTVTATDDLTNDDGESVKLGFGTTLPTGMTAVTPTEATVSITDDDDPAITVKFGTATYTVAEGGNAAVSVELSADPERTVTISITKTNQGGAADADYSGVPTSLTFSAGETSMGFTVTAVDDSVDDDDESVKLGFGTLPTGVTAATPTEATVSITDDDDPAVTVSFGAATYTVAEGGNVAVSVELSADPERTMTISITKTNQGDAADADYSGVPSSLTFSAGETRMSFTVTATDDSVDDDGESVKLGFGSTLPTGVTAATPTEATVNIADNDDPEVEVSFGEAAYEAVEGGAKAVVTVKLSADPERRVTISITKTNQGDAADADYSGVPANVIFSAGETRKSFTVTATDDLTNDDGESVLLGFGTTLPSRVTAATPIEATVALTDDDVPSVTVTFTRASLTIEEGDSKTVTVELSADPERTVTIPITATPQGTATAADYSVPSSVVFAAGQTSKSFTVSATQDGTPGEDNESVQLGFGTLPDGMTTGSGTSVVASLTDDDVREIMLSTTNLTLTEADENQTEIYTVRLGSEPTATVTVELVVSPRLNRLTTLPIVEPMSLTFTPVDWHTTQIVTVTAPPDNDAELELAQVTHTASGGDYGMNGASEVVLDVLVNDDETKSGFVTLALSHATLSETAGATDIVVTGEWDQDGASKTETVLQLQLQHRSGTELEDYTAPSSLMLTIAAQALTGTATFELTPTDDALWEPDEGIGIVGRDLTPSVIQTLLTLTSDDAEPVLSFTASASEMSETGGSVDLVAMITNGVGFENEQAVALDFTAGNATRGTDYTDDAPASGMLVLGAGVVSASSTVTLTAKHDSADEDDEYVEVEASHDDVTIGTAQRVTILDDDTRGVEVSETALTVPEGGSRTYTVVLASQPTGPVTVTPGASGSSDVTVSGALTFTTSSWNVAQTVTVSAAEDADAETDAATVSHTVSGADYGSETVGSVAVTVSENEVASTVVGLSVSPSQVDEAAGATSVVVTGALNGANEATETVLTVTVSGDTASSDDFAAVADFTLTIAANEASGTTTFTLTPVNDALDEDAETVTVDGAVAGFTVNETTLTIADDDTRGVEVSETTLTVPEGGSGTYTVVLESQPTGAVTVTPSASGSSDVTVSGALTFTTSSWNMAQTVTVTAAEDADAETDAATVSHAVSGADYGSETVGSVAVTVSENEVASTAVGLSVSPSQVDEAAGATSVVVTGTLNGAVRTTATTVTVAVSGDTASSGDFAVVADFTLTIAANEASGTTTFTLTPVNDALDEDAETVTIGGAVAGLTVTGTTLTIADDDTRGVEVSETTLTVPEGGSGTYTVVLESQPTGSVTVTPGASGSPDVTVSGALTFTTSSWNLAQTVTVTAAEDADAETDTATVSHAVSGADYGSETAGSVAVTVSENEVASTVVGLSVSPSQVEEDAGATSVTVTGTLNGAVRTTVTTVTVAVSGDTASSGDFAAVADFTLTIAANEASGTVMFTLTPTDDEEAEGDEALSVTGTTTAAGLGVTGTALTIEDDDERGVVVTPTTLTVTEGGTGTYTVVLASQPTGSVTVTPGASGSPDVTVSGALTFTTSSWNLAQTVTVTAAEDADAETDTATVSHAVSGADYGSETAAPVGVTVSENEVASTAVGLSVNPSQVDEAAGATSVVVTGTLNGASETTETVLTVTVSGDTASSGDFATVVDFTLTITAGEASGTATFTLTPVNDAVDESNETVTVGGAVLGLTVTGATLTIADDDTRGVEVSETALTVPEGGSGTYTVVLASQPTGAVTVTPSVSGSLEASVSPSSLSFGSGDWNEAQTVTVSAGQDADAEDDAATISHVVSGADYAEETAADVTVAVTDDETASTAVSLSLGTDSVDEDGEAVSVTVTGTLDGAPRTTDTTVTVSVTGDTASSGDFAQVTDFTLTISALEASGTATFTLTPVDDEVAEGDEMLSVGGTVAGLTVNGTTLTIEDDDTRGVAVTPTTLTVAEGGTGTYTVVLESQPTGAVTVTPSVSGSSDVTASGALTFTTSSWNVAQTVTVSAAEDADAEADTATVSHAVSGADYGSETAAPVAVTVSENEVASTAVDLSVSPSQVGESAGATSVVVTGALNGANETTETVLTVSVTGDTASSGDFAQVTDFTLTISALEASGTATFTLTPVNDEVDEGDEMLSVGGTVAGLTVNGTTLTIEDDDTRGVEVSETALTVPEGDTGAYTVVLASQPTSAVTVTPSVSGSPDVSFSPSSLVFTASDYGAKTVTVSAGQDVDAEDDAATISHAVSGADYGSETAADVAVAVTDDETASTEVSLSLNPVTVDEDGGAVSVTVTGTLDGAPRTTDTTVTVAVSGAQTSSGDFAAVTDFTLTISALEASGTATFTLTPVDDDVDESNETVTVGGTVSGLTVTGATLTIEDDDTRGVAVTPTTLTVAEGGTGSYTVVLESQPTGSVTVTPSASGSSDVSFSPSSLVFAVGDWNVARTVTVSAAEDADAETDTATVSHTVSGADYGSETAGSVAVTVSENEVASTAVGLSVSPSQVDEDAGATSVVVTGALNGASEATETVLTVTVSGDTASSGDFAAVTDFRLTIVADAPSGTATFTLTPVDDALDEEAEVVTIGGAIAGLTVTGATLTIADDDTRGVEVSETALTVPEGGSGTYTVVLESQPTGAVTVTPSVSGSSDVSFSPSSLVFAVGDWNVARTVTVSAAEDVDAETDTATVSHAVSGADYGSETAGPVAVTVSENEVASTAVGLSVSPSQVDENAGATSVVVTGTLNGSVRTTATTVTVSVSGAQASSGDFAQVTDFTLTITANEASGTATFTLTPVDDAVDESNETVTVGGAVAGLTVTGATLTIADDDTRGVEVSETALTVPEGGSGTYTVVLASQPTGPVTVTPGASGSSDVTVSGALTFTTSSWNVAQTVTVTAAEDADAETDTATVSHAVSGADYAPETAGSVGVTVSENEVASTAVGLSVNPDRVGEGAGGTSVVVTGTLDSAVRTTEMVLTVSVSGDTASSGDFAAVTDFTLTISALEASGTATFTLTPVDDALDEGAETVTVGGTVAGLTVNGATLTIEDDDTPSTAVNLSLDPSRIGEGAGATSVVVTGALNGANEATETVLTVSVSGDTASSDDFAAVTDFTLTIAANAADGTATFTLTPVDDALDEADVTVTVGGAVTGLTVNGAILTITDDDTRGVVISETALTVPEGGSGTYTVVLASQPTGAVTVTPSVSGSSDVSFSPSSLVFTESDYGAKTVTVSVLDDTGVEADVVETLEHEVTGADYEQEIAPDVTVTVLGHESNVEGDGVKLLVEPGGMVVVPAGTAVPEGVQVDLPATRAGATVEIRSLDTTMPDEEMRGFRLADTLVDISGVELGPNETATVCLPSSMEGEILLQRWDETLMEWVELANVRQEIREGQTVACGETDHFSIFGVFAQLDEPDLLLSSEALTVVSGEREGATYTVRLGAVPVGSVTVTVTGHAGTDLSVSPVTLEFTEQDWAVAQTVTVTATEGAEPGDREGLTHTGAGASYLNQWSVTLAVTVARESRLQQHVREAWLARFGRTAAEHVADAVTKRVAAPAGQEMALTLDGALQALAGEAGPDMGQVLGNGSFVLPLGPDGLTAWGHGAYTEFDGEEEGLKLDGEVRSGTFGVDVERGDWRWGLALSHSDGDGDIRETDGNHHALKSSLTGAYPYARWQMDEQISAWGVLGYGEGELEQERDGRRTETDLEMRMAALGLRGALGGVETGLGTFDLSLKSDVLAVRMEAEADEELPEVEADASRVRVLLEGSGHRALASGGLVMPTLEAGLRWDEGDAETGLGAELGAGLHFVDETSRLSVDLTARALLAHEESGYEEWGVGGSLRLEPDAAGRGLSLMIESSLGATGSEVNDLWVRRDLSEFVRDEGFEASSRLGMEIGFGLNGPSGFGLLTPNIGYERMNQDTALRLGGSLETGELSLDLESAWHWEGDGDSEHRFKVGISGRW